jgi:hypothetical protein
MLTDSLISGYMNSSLWRSRWVSTLSLLCWERLNSGMNFGSIVLMGPNDGPMIESGHITCGSVKWDLNSG